MTFRAGDTVFHAPSGETWVLACDERGGHVMACGWPESSADASDCTLVEAASDAERLDMLRRVARGKPDEYSYRASLAGSQLAAVEAEGGR